jgi:hypothetical protein
VRTQVACRGKRFHCNVGGLAVLTVVSKNKEGIAVGMEMDARPRGRQDVSRMKLAQDHSQWRIEVQKL